MQQWKLLRLTGILHPNPHKQFITDLSAQVEIDYRSKNQICIIGDMNEILGEDPALMSSLCVKYQLHDAFTQMYPNAPEFTTHIRGSKRKDYMLLSNKMQPVALGYNKFYEIHNSNHRGMYLDLTQLKNYNMNQAIVAGTLQEIGSKSRDVVKFVDTVYMHLHQNKVFHKYEIFQLEASTSTTPWRMANDIDDQIGLAINLGKKACFKYPRPPWSEVLHHASLTLRYWTIAESSVLNKIPTIDVLETIQQSVPALDTHIAHLSLIKKKGYVKSKNLKKKLFSYYA